MSCCSTSALNISKVNEQYELYKAKRAILVVQESEQALERAKQQEEISRAVAAQRAKTLAHTITTRKVHRCTLCKTLIPAGTKCTSQRHMPRNNLDVHIWQDYFCTTCTPLEDV